MPLTESEFPDLLTRQEAAAFLGVAINTVDRMIGRHELEAFKLGRSVRISKPSAIAAIAKTSTLRAPLRRVK